MTRKRLLGIKQYAEQASAGTYGEGGKNYEHSSCV